MNCPDPVRAAVLAVALALLPVGTALAADPPVAPANPASQVAPANPATLSTGQVDGPIEVEPSWATADAARSHAILHTVLTNYGAVADRLIQVRCPYAGRVGLLNGTLHADVMAPTPPQEQRGAVEARNANTQQNGLDLPAAVNGQPTPVTAEFALDEAREPLGTGALVPCTINLAHGGQRIVVFTVGNRPDPVSEP